MFPGANAFRKLFRRTAAAEGVAAAVRPRVRMQVEEIEPRILYSADLAPGLVTDAGPAPVQMRVVAPVTTQSTDTQETRRHELVVVDTATQDYQFLVDDIVANAGPERRFDVLLIDAGRDGIAEVTGALASMQDIDAVHVISHGSDGVVRLGSAVLDAQVLEERGDEIARWAASLTANADLLIYGCDVAASVQGQALADGLAALTGADVAASEDPTGSAARGGDWELEYGAGAVETLVALSPLVQAQWQGLLATDVVIHQYDTALGGLDDSELKSDQSWGQRFRHDSAGATYQVDKVAVVLSRASDAPAGQTVTVSLRSTFSGAVIASGTVSSNALSTSPAWVTIALNSSATLNDNQNYVIRVDGSNQKLYVGTDGSGNYSTGDLLDKSGAAQGGKDMAFRLIDTVPTAAPVLNGANNLTGTNEDSASNNGTLVSALIAGQVTLDPLLSTTGIAVTGVDNTNGQWQYTTDGTTWNAFGAVTETSSRLLAADANNAVRFVPNANWNGTVTNGLTFRAWDQTSGTDGGTADSSTTNLTFRDNFNINSYSNNDGTGTWSASWVDTDGSFNSGQIQITGNRLEFDGGAASSSTIYRDVNLSGATSAILTFDFSNSVDPGTLTLRISSNGGASYTTLENNFPAGSFAATADITAFASANTRIRFDVVGDPGLLGIGAGGPFRVDNLQIAYVQARSGGNTAFSTATASSSITVAAVNDAPAGAATTKTILEEGSHVFALADFGFTDASDTPANNFTAVRIATLPGAGALTLGGIAVTAGQSIAAADVTAGNLRFTPVAGANGTAYASFTFRVEDDGGTANGGVNVDTTARTFTFDVTSVNDAPQGTTATLATPEDVPLVLNAAAFGFTDPGDTPANSLAAVRIESLPGAGTLTLSGAAVAAGQTIAVADLNAGRLVFTSAANVSGAGYASFTFRVQDDGATANGGVDLDASARTLTIDVTARNDAPVGASNTLTTTEETPLVFSAAQFGFTDPNDAAPNAFAAVRISALPTAGALTLAGAAVTAGQSVTVADITAGRLVFTPGLNGAGAGYASFAFQVQDDGGTANGGTDLDPTARTMTIDVTNVNDAPLLSGANNLTAILEDAVANSGTLVSALLAGQANDPDASALSGIAVTAVDNTNGAWQYSTNAGASWNAFGFVATGHARLLAADANTYVRFVPNANWNGTVASGLTFRAWDQMIGANGGTAPTIANPVLLDTFSTVSYANQNGTGGWSTNWVDAGGSAAGGDIGVSGGALTIRTKNNADGPIYRQADLSHATSATLSFTYNNPLGAGDGGSIVLEISGDGGGSYTTLATFSDAANVGPGAFSRNVSAFIAANTRIQFRVVSDSIPNRTFSVDNVQIAYTAAGNGAATAFSTATASAGITVTAVNDAPAGANNTVTAAEDAAFIFSAAHFGFSDSADAPANALAAVRVDALPGVGALTLSGAAVGAGQSIAIADIAAGRLAFTAAANANGAGYASFTFRVQDDGGTANGGVNLDPTARTMTINVTAVNDAPTGTTVTLATLEDTPVVLNAAAFGFTDTADTPANNLRAVRIATLPSAGALTLNGAAVIAGQSISAVDLAAGNLVFTPGANANGASHASFTFQVQDDGGTANGGIDLDPVARTMTIDVTPVNDAAVGANRTVTALEDTAFVFDVAAFGLIDAADAPANALAAVRISSLPAAGSLTLNGAAVNAGDTVTAADIAAGRLAFTPGAQANGAGYASFTFQVQDDGGTANGGADLDPVARTMTIDVTAVNDAPVGTSTTAAGFENAPLTLTAANFGFTDPSDTPAHSLGAVRITSLPTAGTLRLSGVGVTAGQTISAADIGAGNLVFTPAADANGNAYATLTFQVQDSGGTLNGGADLDAVARTLTIDLAPVNSAPVGTNATVSVFEDTSFALSAAHFGFTDPNDTAPNNLAAVTISAVPTAGSLILSGVAVTAGQSIALADINAGNLRFLAAADAAGTAYASFGFRVQDDGGTANGGVDLDTTARTITFDVTNVNDAPTGADRTVTALEDTAFVFDLAAFALTDPADAVANNLAAVRIAAVPTSGSLTLNGVAVNAGDFVTAADIVAGRLAFTPGADAAGAGYASFTFQVQDDGGTVNGGIDLDAVARTMTIDVTAVNDAPAGTSGTVTAVENAPFVFTAAAFGFTDPADAPGHNLSAVTVSALPALGTLTLSGVAVTAGQSIAIADIDAGNLAFTPAAHANGAGYTSFTFQVQDDGGAANGGVNLDATARTLTIDVTPANSAPVGTANTVVTLEDTPLPLTLAHFGFTDPNDTPANLPVAVTISSLPTAGTLALSGVALTAGQSITVADIAAGNLVYTPGANGAGAAYATFTFRVQDDGGTANGGAAVDPVARMMTIDVASVNDAPRSFFRTVTQLEDTPYAFQTSDFIVADASDSPANALFAVRIASLPTAGSLTLNGAAVAVGDFISVADIAAGNFTFTPALNAFGNNHARFTFQVQDDGGTANGGVNLDAIARTLQMNVTRVSDAPVGTSGSVTAIEDTIFTFTAAAFGFTDAADSPSHVFQALHITSLPTLGALTLNGVALTAGDVVSIADIDAGALRFAAAADGAGAAYASFAFRVEDSGGTANGGLDVDTMDRTMTINVTPVNDRPAGTNATVRTAEDTPLTLNAAMFGFTDPRDTPADTLKAVRITSLPTQGSLTLSGVAVTVGQTVQAADIAAGRLVFTAPADVAGQPFATFTFRVQDDGGTANAGADIDLTPNTLTVVVDAVNDAPSGRDNIVSTLVNVAVTIDVGAFGFYDPIDPVADAFIAVQMVTVPSTGSLTLSGVAVQAGQVVSTADIAAGRLTYTPARDAVGPAGFTFKVQDSGGTADGGVDLALVARTLTVDVRAPVITAVEVQAPVANTAPPAETRAPSSTPAPAAGASESPQAPREAAATATPPVAPEPEIPAAVGATTDAGAVATRSVQVNVQRAEFQPPNRETRTTIPTTLASEIQSLVLLSERSETQSESSGVLTSSQSRAARADIAPAAAARQMTEQMDQMRDGLRHETRIESGTIAATAATSLGLSVGYVIWVLRGGVLLSTLVSSLPAWRLVDPLPVLGRMDAEDDGEGDDSLESLVDGGEEPADPDARKSADDAEGVQA
ncbi:MAG TPA: cadherin-like domain-containing protein [Burkholderiales bacterium]|nr:cadherin-like domain-containing protein [Burkholderiales bacterium]